MNKYDIGTKLKDARNRQIYPYTKVECVEGLEGILDNTIKTPDDVATNSVPITSATGDVTWVELQAGNIVVKVSNDVFASNDLETVLVDISNEIKRLESMVGTGGGGGGSVNPDIPAGFIPVLMSELPETGKVGVVYRIPSENTSSRNQYDEFYWTGSAFEKIGTREPDGDEWNSEDGDSGYEWIN